MIDTIRQHLAEAQSQHERFDSLYGESVGLGYVSTNENLARIYWSGRMDGLQLLLNQVSSEAQQTGCQTPTESATNANPVTGGKDRQQLP